MIDSKLAEIFGNRITDDKWERISYSKDLGEIPPVLRAALRLETVPDLVIRPQTTEEVLAVVEFARKGNIPVTPRGSGSSGFFNSVPVKKGISLDMSGMDAIGAVDEETCTVTVGAGVRWEMLDRKLRKQGYAVKSYPTSAPTATVGGWINMEGFGIGSLMYGSLISQISKMEVVLPSVISVWITNETSPSLDWFGSSDGTLGVVTQVCLSVRKAPEAEGHLLLSFPDESALGEAIGRLTSQDAPPYNISYLHSSYFRFIRKMGHQTPEGVVLGVDYEGTIQETEAGRQHAAQVAADLGATLLSEELGQAEWKDRFKHLALKRLGPSVLAAEDWLSPAALIPYHQELRTLEKKLNTEFYSYGTVVAPDKLSVFTGYLTDSRKDIAYTIALTVTARLHQVAIGLGGRPLGVGLWNTPYLPHIYSAETLKKLRRNKKTLDPKNIMNPGKHYAWPALLHPMLFSLGSNIVSTLQRFTGKR